MTLIILITGIVVLDSKHAVCGGLGGGFQELPLKVTKLRDVSVWESYVTSKGWTRFPILMVLLAFPILKNRVHQKLVYCYIS